MQRRPRSTLGSRKCCEGPHPMGDTPHNYCDEALAGASIQLGGAGGMGRGKIKQPKQADVLVEIAVAECQLFHNADRIAYADITISGHRETLPVRRKSFKAWL